MDQILKDPLPRDAGPDRAAITAEIQKLAQRIIGALKFPEPLYPVLMLPLHKLSCIMSYPPEGALLAAKLARTFSMIVRIARSATPLS